MLLAWPLQVMIRGETFRGSGKTRILTYNRAGNRKTTILGRFLRQLDILRHLSNIFRITMCTDCLHEGKNEGFFRIPQVPLFLSDMSRNLSDKDIAELPSIIAGDEEITELLPLLDKLGSELARLYKLQDGPPDFLEGSLANASNQVPQTKRKFQHETDQSICIKKPKRTMPAELYR
jgi:hypothetical protein